MPEDAKIGTNDIDAPQGDESSTEQPKAAEPAAEQPKAAEPAAEPDDDTPSAKEFDEAIAEVNKQIADARAAIDEERKSIEEAESRLAQLLDEKARVHPPLDPSVNIKQYLESQAAARAARHEGAQMAAAVLGIRRPADLAKSPLDRRVAAENRAKRRAQASQVFDPNAGKGE